MRACPFIVMPIIWQSIWQVLAGNRKSSSSKTLWSFKSEGEGLERDVINAKDVINL